MRFRRPRPPDAPRRDRDSARALAESQAKLHREREQVVVPLQQILRQNNVTELVRELIRKGAAGERGTAASG